MQSFQTIGKSIYPGLVLNIQVRDNLEFASIAETDLMQLMYIETGLVVISRSDGAFKLNPPLLLCLNHAEPADHLAIQNGIGFSIIFKPDVVNHSLGPGGVGASGDRSYALNQVLVEPFRESRADNPVWVAADANLQKRIHSIHQNLVTQLGEQPDTSWPCRGRSFFLELMVILQSFWGQKDRDDRGLRLPGGNPVVEEVARQACIGYPDPGLDLRRIAASLDLAPRGLSRRFREAAGESFGAFMGRLRLSMASTLVRNTILDLEQIRVRIGYRFRFQMDLAFRLAFGVSPSRYRDEHPDPYG